LISFFCAQRVIADAFGKFKSVLRINLVSGNVGCGIKAQHAAVVKNNISITSTI